MTAVRTYLIPVEYELDVLWKEIAALYALEEISVEQTTYSCLDTYDWRLYRKGYFVSRKRATYFLEDGVGQQLVKGVGSRKKYPFWWDLEPGELQDILEPVMEVRALQEQFTLRRTTEQFRLLNRDKKTVLRLSLVRANVARPGDESPFDVQNIMHVESLRGYPKPLRKVSAILESEELSEWGGNYASIGEAMERYGIDPLATSSKFEIDLKREESVDEVVSDICSQLRGTMIQTLPGLREDIDSEFLHDFRVALRRTRSLLTLLKKYLDVEELPFFRDELKWLGSVTGPTRDLDVYLLAKEDFRAMLPPLLHPGLASFFNDLEVRRKKSIRMLRRSLASERFSTFMQRWELFLKELPDKNKNPAGKKSCHTVARKIIRKRLERILRDGGRITADSPDEKLHDLRIEGKKCRYLLEFFRSLFVTDAVDQYHSQLKRLQNNLGDFNDIAVQSEMLSAQIKTLAVDHEHGVSTGAALGGLIVHLQDRKKMVRRKFEKTFKRFASQENRELLESIIADSGTTRGGGK